MSLSWDKLNHLIINLYSSIHSNDIKNTRLYVKDINEWDEEDFDDKEIEYLRLSIESMTNKFRNESLMYTLKNLKIGNINFEEKYYELYFIFLDDFIGNEKLLRINIEKVLDNNNIKSLLNRATIGKILELCVAYDFWDLIDSFKDEV